MTSHLDRADGTRELPVPTASLPTAAGQLLTAGYRLALVAAHDDGVAGFHVAYDFAHADGRRREIVVRVPRTDPTVPSLAAMSFSAGRFERAMSDQFGIVPVGHPHPRLVLHDHWPDHWYPMRRDADPHPSFGPDLGAFSFLPVEGKGVYEIPVGPVHAGMIEPGHFRFAVVGETIVRTRVQLWFVHRGIEKLFEGRMPDEGIALAERVSGDTAVGHALAYAMAVEGALGLEVCEEDRMVRALLLELERLYNHVSDLGAMANDVGFGIAHTHTQRLREALLRHNKEVTGHRLLRGGITIGGSALRALPDPAFISDVAAEVADVVAIVLGNAVVADRFTTTAVLPREAAEDMGVLGYVARASGVAIDARRDHPFVDLGEAFRVCTREEGDVAARFGVRADEVSVSAALVSDLVQGLSGRTGSGTATHRATTGAVATPGLALVEAWRGTLCHRVELDPDGTLARVAIVDPSFFTWPALPVTLADTIVPDFPLANKSFNQSYAGNDL